MVDGSCVYPPRGVGSSARTWRLGASATGLGSIGSGLPGGLDALGLYVFHRLHPDGLDAFNRRGRDRGGFRSHDLRLIRPCVGLRRLGRGDRHRLARREGVEDRGGLGLVQLGCGDRNDLFGGRLPERHLAWLRRDERECLAEGRRLRGVLGGGLLPRQDELEGLPLPSGGLHHGLRICLPGVEAGLVDHERRAVSEAQLVALRHIPPSRPPSLTSTR